MLKTCVFFLINCWKNNLYVQAYRKGLEVEISRLTEENSRLKRQLKEVSYFLNFLVPSFHPILTISVIHSSCDFCKLPFKVKKEYDHFCINFFPNNCTERKYLFF